MRRGTIALATLAGAVALAAPASALAAAAPAASGDTVTATGTAEVRVRPADRHSNSSIAAAVEAAHRAGIAGALAQAQEYAQEYASAVGLTLGSVESVTDVVPQGGYGFGSFFGPFGPNQFCGTIRQAVFKGVRKHRKVIRFKKVHRCFVPQFEATTLTVTYSASPAS